MSSLAASLASIQQGIIRYGFPISLTLGIIGTLFIILIFSQKHHRKNSCSLYLLVAATFTIIGISCGIGTNMYTAYNPPDPFTQSLFLCRFRGYLLQSSTLMYKIMISLACMDRFAVCSTNVKIRGLTKPKMAIKIIIGLTLFGMLVSIHLPIKETIQNNQCFPSGTYGLFFSFYQIFIYGLILPVTQIIFAYLTAKNLKTVRIRVQPQIQTDNQTRNVLSKRDVTLMKLVLVEIIIGLILTIPFPINTLYTVLASDVLNKSVNRIAIEGFMFFFILIVLFYLNYCITFYLYITVSKAFRQEIKQFILKIIKRPEREQSNTVSIGLTQRHTINTN